MRVYHFTKEKYGLEDLIKRRLKVATITDLNDPFEFIASVGSTTQERTRFLKIKRKIAASIGLLCFRPDWRNPVQWSHYADKHRGLCLGFDVPDNLLLKVTYSSKRPKPSADILKNNDLVTHAHIRHLARTKCCQWSYESEYRLLLRLRDMDTDKGLYFQPFSKELQIREVIVGHESSLSRSALKNALVNLSSKLTTTKARLAFKSFEVVRQKNQKLWH